MTQSKITNYEDIFSYEMVKDCLQNNVSIKLLKKDHAALIISFLAQQFKIKNKLTIPQSDLSEGLEYYLEELNQLEAKSYLLPAKDYLIKWTDEGFLRSYYEQNDEPVYKLTFPTEKVIFWFNELQEQTFVGTESQFLEILQLLKQIIAYSTEEPEIRLAQLEEQKAEIEAEIAEIRQTGEVNKYSDAKLREWFIKAGNAANKLVSDFSQIEDNFKELTNQIQKAQLEAEQSKGDILSLAIDANAELKKSEQGRSFYAFSEFLRQPSQNEFLETIIKDVYDLVPLAHLIPKYPTLKNLKNILLRANTKVVASNQRLVEQLRKLLDREVIIEHKRVADLLQEIKMLAKSVADHPPQTENFIDLADKPEIAMAMVRPLWDQPEIRSFNAYEHGDQENPVIPPEVLRELYNPFYIARELLHQRIAAMLQLKPAVTLGELLREYPAEKGIPEVIAYLLIAHEDPRYLVQPEPKEQVELLSSDEEKIYRLQLPFILFQR